MDILSLAYFPILFILGAAIGSFLNVVIDRIPQGKGIISGRSHCDNCKRTLLTKDLIPIVSYLLLGGKCRFCKSKISPRLFFVEISTGLFFPLVYYLSTLGILSLENAIYSIIIFCLFFSIFFADVIYGIIPDQLLVVLGITTFTYLLLTEPSVLMSHVLTGIGLFAFFILIFFLTSGKGMGFGDVKLSFLLGFYLGFPNVVVGIYLAFLTGAAVSIILILWGKKRLRHDTIPFGPFLVASAFLSYFLGKTLIAQALLYLVH